MKNLFRIITIISLMHAAPTLADVSGSDVAEELALRFQTERLSTTQKLELLKEAVSTLDLRNRIIFYANSLNKLGEQKFPIQETDQLFLNALADLKQVPRGMFKEGGNCDWGDNEALGCFAKWSMKWAMSNIGMSPYVAKQYIEAFFEMPWLDSLTVQGVALDIGRNRNLQYPYMRELVTQLLKTHFSTPVDYDANIAFQVLSSVRYKSYCNNVKGGCFQSYGFSYTDSLWILDAVMASGKPNASGRKGLADLRNLFVIGVEFENRVGNLLKPTDIETVGKTLKQMILQPGQAPAMAEIVLDWLMKNQVSDSLKVELVDALLLALQKTPESAMTIEFEYSSRGALDVLTHLPVLVELPKRVQEDIYSFIISKNKGDDEKSRLAREMVQNRRF